MKERGKALDDANGFNSNFIDFSCSFSTTDFPCKKHPSSSSGGICAYCLKDRLVNLVCSECGEQRLSSCSCSDASSNYRNSCTGEIGSVGRISFLIENEKSNENGKLKKGYNKSDDEVILLRRSSSSCVEIKRSKNGFWKIKRLFIRKKKEKGCEKDDEKSDLWVGDAIKGVSRSRSLCSFRGGGGVDEGSDYAFQSGKISDVTGGIVFDSDKSYYGGLSDVEPRRSGLFRGFSDAESEPRKSGFRGLSDADIEPRKSGFRCLWDAENEPRKSGFKGLSDAENEPRRSGFRGLSDAETEPRKSGFRGLSDAENEPRRSGYRGFLDSESGGSVNFKAVKKMGGPGELNRVNSVPNRSIFPVKESDFSAMDESAFIDLKLELSSESKREFSAAARISAASDHDGSLRTEFYASGASMGNARNNGLGGGSCRITVNEKDTKSGSRSNKVWKWIFKQNPGRRSASKKDEQNIQKS